MDRKVMRKIINVMIVATFSVVALEYAMAWKGVATLVQAEALVQGSWERPFVYRALMPLAARVLWTVGVRADMAIVVVVFCSAIGLMYGIDYFFRSFEQR